MSDEAEQPEATRVRRPSSLRSSVASPASDATAAPEPSVEESGPKLTTPAFARKLTPPSFPSKLTVPPLPGKLTPPAFLRRDAKPAVPGHSTDPLASDGGPPEAAGPSPSQKLVTLVSERPEVGLGIAFAAGLVIATILKRLAR